MFARPRPTLLLRGGEAALVALVSLAHAGCGADAAPGTWVGAASDSDVVVAVAEVEGGGLVAYVCGGEATFATHTRWFQADSAEGGGFEAARDGWTVAGEIDGEAASGTITGPAGEALSFSASAVDEGAALGLFAVEDSGCRTGAVVQAGADGEPWLQGTWCDEEDHFAQVTPVAPIELTDRGIRVQVLRAALGLPDIELHVARFPAR